MCKRDQQGYPPHPPAEPGGRKPIIWGIWIGSDGNFKNYGIDPGSSSSRQIQPGQEIFHLQIPDNLKKYLMMAKHQKIIRPGNQKRRKLKEYRMSGKTGKKFISSSRQADRPDPESKNSGCRS